MEVLRCCLCGKTFTAPPPPEAETQKYDPSVGVRVSLLRYGSGMPFYRLEQLQRSLGVPLAASTQWELADAVARVAQPAGDHLTFVAAQAPNVFNDDTSMRVGALRRQIRAETKPPRTGLFTTGIRFGLTIPWNCFSENWCSTSKRGRRLAAPGAGALPKSNCIVMAWLDPATLR